MAGLHNLEYALKNATLSSAFRGLKITGSASTTSGYALACATSAPTTSTDLIPHALCWVEGVLYYNSGTKASPTWSQLIAAATGGAFTTITVSSTAEITGAATFLSTCDITGATTITGLLNANGGIAVDTSNFTVSGTTGAVVSASTYTGTGLNGVASTTLAIAGSATGNSKVTIQGGGTGDVELGNATNVNIELTSATEIDLTSTAIDINGTCDVSGNFTVATSKVVVTATTGATIIGNLTGLASQAFLIDANTTQELKLGTVSTGNITIGDSDVTTCTLGADTVAITQAATVGGTLNVTGLSTLASLTVSGTANIGILALDAVAAATTNATLTLNGNNSGGVNICSTSTGGITLGDDVTVSASKAMTFAGVADSNILVVTAGNTSLADGSLTIVHTANAAALSVTNNTITDTGSVATISSSSGTSAPVLTLTNSKGATFVGPVLQVVSTGSTSSTGLVDISMTAATDGVGLHIHATEATLTTGKYIQCYDNAADDFSVSKYGATVIAGNASGTAALTLTAGDFVMSSGKMTLAGAAVDSVNLLTITRSNTATTTGHALDIAMGTAAIAGNAVNILFGAGAGTGDAVAINMGSNLAGGALTITVAGGRTDATIDITDTSTSNSPSIDINVDGVRTGNGLDITYATAAATENAIDLNMGTNVAGMALSVASAATGTSGEGSAFDVQHTGNLAAGADVVRIYSSGDPSATSNLVSIEQETGAGLAGAYGLYISCAGANVEAINVAAGKVVFAENLTITAGGITFGATGLTITEGDASNWNIDAGAANENINIGSTTATDFILHGTGAGQDCSWISATNTMTFAANANLVCTAGSGAGNVGMGLVIPNGTASPDFTTAGAMYFETDTKKLWIYDGAGMVSVTLA